MNTVANLLLVYGFFLMTCGIVAVIFIGLKAKTALASGGTSGAMALVIAYYAFQEQEAAKWAGIILTAILFGVFSWRATQTLFKLLKLVAEKNAEFSGKSIAFLIISLMAVMSLMVFTQLVIN